VGAIFYELLGSQKPFPADTITGVMFRIRHEQADPAALPPTDFSPGLEKIVLRAMLRDPQKRYSSLQELRDDLVELVKETAPKLAARRAGTVSPAPATLSPEEAPEAAPDAASLHSALDRARERGESELALAMVRRLLDIDPDDARARQVADEIEAEGREREAEQLCGIALAYAADGEMEKAAEIAEKIERLSPWSPRYLQLQVYLDEEGARLDSERLAGAARERLLAGDCAGAQAAAEEALALFPMHRLAQEVRERARLGLAVPKADPEGAADDDLARDLADALFVESSAAPAASTSPEPVPAVAIPVTPSPPAAPALAEDPSRNPDSGDPASGASAVEAKPSRPADVEILTSVALDRFLQDDHPGARRAAAMALELDPRNRKALELLKILGAIG